jgi:CDP-diacylglycerol--glycerol-3-phosphate 3-phosphatidyltransferase
MNAIITIPNILTFLRIASTPVFVYSLISNTTPTWVALVIFLFASITDFFDGYLARKLDAKSTWGTFLDPLADKILVLAAFGAFYAVGLIELWMVIVVVLRDLLVTLLRTVMVRGGSALRTSRIAKWKTSLQFCSIYLILGYIGLKQLPRNEIVHGLHDFFLTVPIISMVMHLMVFVTIYSGALYLINHFAFLNRS